jgi:hypothetical protein
MVADGGSGMDRELMRQLRAEGCAIAVCDLCAHGIVEMLQPTLPIAFTSLSKTPVSTAIRLRVTQL